jgi:hypothetical protein
MSCELKFGEIAAASFRYLNVNNVSKPNLLLENTPPLPLQKREDIKQ